MKKYITVGLMAFLALSTALPVSAETLASRLKGRILLQVESRGEAWYVNPVTLTRIYLKDGNTAYTLMRQLGLGISNTDLSTIPIGIESRFSLTDSDGDGLFNKLEEALGTDPNLPDTDGDGHSDATEVRASYSPTSADAAKLRTDGILVNRLRGRILLQVQSKGEAWYLNPVDGKRYYLPDGESAYQIMRYLSLGITNADLNQISRSDEMNDWKTYTSTDLNFSIQYPSTWSVDEARSNRQVSGNDVVFNTGQSGLEAIRMELTTQSLAEWVNSLDQNIITGQSSLTLDGEAAMRIDTSESEQTIIAVKFGDRLYVLTTQGLMLENGMLDTFKIQKYL